MQKQDFRNCQPTGKVNLDDAFEKTRRTRAENGKCEQRVVSGRQEANESV